MEGGTRGMRADQVGRSRQLRCDHAYLDLIGVDVINQTELHHLIHSMAIP